MENIISDNSSEKLISKNNTKINLRKSIKSVYITKIIFSFVCEHTKLKLITYNKNYQNFFGIKLKNYIFESGKYIKSDKNGNTKEYELSKIALYTLSYEGKYLNGKRNGKGKEYYKNGKIKFEGEYLNGKRWNGKGYNIRGVKVYEIKNGKGKIKEFYDDGLLKYEGEYLNGKGMEFDKEIGRLKFIGSYINGKRNGKGKEYYINGKVNFEGDYLYGKRWNGKTYDNVGNLVCENKNGKEIFKDYIRIIN